MSVLDPMWTAWQRTVGQRTWDRVVEQTGLPVTNSVPFIPDGSMDKSPAHHLVWSYKSQAKRIFKSWRKRNSSGIARRELSRKVLDEASRRWTHGLSKWMPEGTMALVYDDLGVFRIAVKFADVQGPMIEGVNNMLAASDASWSCWIVGNESERVYAGSPGEAVRLAIFAWANNSSRAYWVRQMWAESGHKFVSEDGHEQAYGRPWQWDMRTISEKEVS